MDFILVYSVDSVQAAFIIQHNKLLLLLSKEMEQ